VQIQRVNNNIVTNHVSLELITVMLFKKFLLFKCAYNDWVITPPHF
jgi:hypothetical protein